MTGLPKELVLGGHRAVWVWGTPDDPHATAEPRTGVIPCAVLIDHGDHTMLVPWVELAAGGTPFTLESLLPLTVREHVECPTCGRTGYISGGAWLPQKDVAHG